MRVSSADGTGHIMRKHTRAGRPGWMGCWLPPCRRRRRAALLHARNTRTLCDSHLMFFAFDMSKLMTWLKAVAPENISLYQAEDAVTAEEEEEEEGRASAVCGITRGCVVCGASVLRWHC